MALIAIVGSSVLPGVDLLRGLNEVTPAALRTAAFAVTEWPVFEWVVLEPPLPAVEFGDLRKPTAHTTPAITMSTITTTTVIRARLVPRRSGPWYGAGSYWPPREPPPDGGKC